MVGGNSNSWLKKDNWNIQNTLDTHLQQIQTVTCNEACAYSKQIFATLLQKI